MGVLKRIVGIIVNPEKEWEAIVFETTPIATLFVRYILPLCFIAPVALVIGMTTFDTRWDPLHGYSVPHEKIAAVGVANFIFSLLTIFFLALIFHWLTPVRGKRSSFAAALRVAAYGATPVMLAGAFLVLPVMILVTVVASVHSLFLINAGLRKVLHVPEGESAMLLAMAIVMLCVSSAVIGGIASMLGLI